MLEAEDKELITKLTEHVTRIEADYEAGLTTEDQYHEVCDLLEDAEAKILAIANRED